MDKKKKMGKLTAFAYLIMWVLVMCMVVGACLVLGLELKSTIGVGLVTALPLLVMTISVCSSLDEDQSE